ncbi:YHS domain-containing (seleno)protein [Roseibium sp.]|uniref:YHS domain-containing (seleno)protein n=1 Tax=Roseibium sp. TaxID=1936156 RepID=UPI003A9743F5
MQTIKTIAAATLFGLAALTGTAHAADEYNTSSGLTAAGKPLGLHGVDPVAFVDLHNRIDGAARFTAVHDGVSYYFASEEAKAKFEAHPADYLPQNGGFCTFGVSVGKKFDGNPKFAAVVDDKLYLFLNEAIFHEFQKDQAGTISKAAANWKKIRSVAAAEL